MTHPEIVCLCGSTRFMAAFQKANIDLTLAGKIILSIGCNTKSDDCLGLDPTAKERLDELHKRKIDLCNRVLVLNVGGYIGSSTRSEIEYAVAHGKPVDYLEPCSVCGRSMSAPSHWFDPKIHTHEQVCGADHFPHAPAATTGEEGKA